MDVYKNLVYNMIARVQYNAALAITGAIKGTSQQKIYNELGFESLRFRRWFRRLCAFYKIKTTQLPSYMILFLKVIIITTHETSDI